MLKVWRFLSNRVVLTWGWAALASLVCIFALSASALGTEECPGPHLEHYLNREYGFEFDVPPDLVGHWASPCSIDADEHCVCMGNHGLSMPLGPDAVLSVYADYAAWLGTDESSAMPKEILRMERSVLPGEIAVDVSAPRPVSVAGRPGWYVVKKIQHDHGVPATQVLDYWYIDPKAPLALIVGLSTLATDAHDYTGRLNKLLESLHWLPPQNATADQGRAP